ncbi:MAG: hypothetical protein NUV67_04865 [archaeon]|nr:hypothetical protein [archaeon]
MPWFRKRKSPDKAVEREKARIARAHEESLLENARVLEDHITQMLGREDFRESDLPGLIVDLVEERAIQLGVNPEILEKRFKIVKMDSWRRLAEKKRGKPFA